MNASRFQDLRRSIERQFREQPGRANRALRHLVARNAAATIIVDRRIIGWRMKNGQIVCVKQRYSSEEQAANSMQHIASLEQVTGRIPVRVYNCEYCCGWHMTSQERKGL